MSNTIKMTPHFIDGRIVDTLAARDLWAELDTADDYEPWLMERVTDSPLLRIGKDYVFQKGEVHLALVSAFAIVLAMGREAKRGAAVYAELHERLAPRIEADLGDWDWELAYSGLPRELRKLCNVRSYSRAAREKAQQVRFSQSIWLASTGLLKADNE